MAEKDYPWNRPLERPTIQLADASGPQPLADESNYEFLQKVFDAKEQDPLAKAAYDVDSVFQILEGMKGYGIFGKYSKDLKTSFERLKKSDYEDLERLAPNIYEANKGVLMMQPWNTDEGIITLIHEFRHKAIDDDPVLRKIVDDSRFPEELIVRAMDVKYFDDDDAKKEIEKYNLTEYGEKLLYEFVDKLEEASLPKKEEKEEPSFFSKLKEKLGFNQGGIADINYLTRRL
jgi:hypothetical protein